MAETLTKEEITEKVRHVVSRELQVDMSDIQTESLFVDDLGADSLDLTELAVAFEDEFDLEIPESDFGQLSKVSGVVDYIAGRLA